MDRIASLPRMTLMWPWWRSIFLKKGKFKFTSPECVAAHLTWQLAFIGMVEIVRVLEEYHNEYRNCSVASSRRTSRTPIWEPQSPKNVLLSWKMKSPVPPIQNQNLWWSNECHRCLLKVATLSVAALWHLNVLHKLGMSLLEEGSDVTNSLFRTGLN